MSRIFRLSIDEETLTDELFAFVVDPRSTRYQRFAWSRRAEGDRRRRMIPVMEMMITAIGVEERRYVRRVRQRRAGRRRADQDVYYAT